MNYEAMCDHDHTSNGVIASRSQMSVQCEYVICLFSRLEV